MKPAANHFHVKAKISANFQIWISVNKKYLWVNVFKNTFLMKKSLEDIFHSNFRLAIKYIPMSFAKLASHYLRKTSNFLLPFRQSRIATPILPLSTCFCVFSSNMMFNTYLREKLSSRGTCIATISVFATLFFAITYFAIV